MRHHFTPVIAWTLVFAVIVACQSAAIDPMQGPAGPAPSPEEQSPQPPWVNACVLYEAELGPFGDGGSDLDGDGLADVVISNRDLHTDFLPYVRQNFVLAVAPRDGQWLQRWSGGAGFGYRVACGGDADGDGHGDVLVTSGDVHGDDSANLSVLSGRTGEKLHDMTFVFAGDDLAWVGDLDGDGLDDFAITVADDVCEEPIEPCFRLHGSFGVELRTGRDGRLLWRHLVRCEAYNRGFLAVEPIGDLDLDGIPDVLAGLPGQLVGCESRTQAVVLSGASGAPLVEFPELPVGLEAHEAMSAAGDLDGDGRPDIVLGCESDAGDRGAVIAFSPSTGQVLRRWEGDQENDAFGWAVAGLGDVDGNGLADVLIGEEFKIDAHWPNPDRMLVVGLRSADG